MGNSTEVYKQIKYVIEAKQYELRMVKGKVKQPVHIKKPLTKLMGEISS